MGTITTLICSINIIISRLAVVLLTRLSRGARPCCLSSWSTWVCRRAATLQLSISSKGARASWAANLKITRPPPGSWKQERICGCRQQQRIIIIATRRVAAQWTKTRRQRRQRWLTRVAWLRLAAPAATIELQTIIIMTTCSYSNSDI